MKTLKRIPILLSLIILASLCLKISSTEQTKTPPPKTGAQAGYNYPTASKISGQKDIRLQRETSELELNYAARANKVVFQSTWHCSPDESQSFLKSSFAHQVVSILYPFYGKSIKSQGLLTTKFGFYSCGFCHQNAEVLRQVLTSNGVQSKVVGLQGHVVTQVTIGQQSYFLDPDLGVGPILKQEPSPLYSSAVFEMYTAAGINKKLAARITKMYMNSAKHENYTRRTTEEFYDHYTKPQERGLWLIVFLEKHALKLACLFTILSLLAAALLFRSY